MTRFPTGHKVPKFTVFASLLRMAAKYGFPDVREQLAKDIRGAYPTKWEDFEAARVLGEDIFGSPKPHPIAVLNLLLEHNIRFALPFAAYRACIGGFPALVSDEPGMVPPRLALASIIHGMGVLKSISTVASYDVLHLRCSVCPDRSCALSVGLKRTTERAEALRKVFLVMIKGGGHGVDILSPLSLGTIVCVGCARAREKGHLGFRKEHIWAKLPGLLNWESWEGV